MTKAFLHTEGLAVFIGSIIAYGTTDYSWWIFIILLLAPDLSMLGYLQNEKVGAYVYNVFHTYVLALFVIGIGYLMASTFLIGLGFIWTAHIGMDRMLGFGLKYTDSFQSTHLAGPKKV